MSLIQKINDSIQNQKNEKIDSPNIFIVDFKNINGGEVEILSTEPEFNYVHLSNDNKIEVYYVAFKDNALRVQTEQGQVSQCECVLFPTSLAEIDWVLFIETKYTNSLKKALDEGIDYPNTMIKQIISTVNYFRERDLLPNNKRVHAIVAFPKLIEDFSEAFFTRSEMTIEEILRDHKILIRATNRGQIITQKRIKI